jgi:glycosyltransferase involved in cell wall biosynthesis
VHIALDATYSLGRNLSGVGAYSRKLLWGLAQHHPDQRLDFYYRPHRFLRSFQDTLPPNARRRLLWTNPRADLFHALNQRVDFKARRTITTFHDLFVISGDYSLPDFRARFAQQARDAAERSDHIIAVSTFTARQVESLLRVDADRITVIPHGVDPVAPTNTPREKLVLFTGAIQKRKNVARLIEAFAALPAGWKLILAGAADGFAAQEELAALDSSPRHNDIQLPGYVSAAQLADLYARASIFAFPSLDEGFGLPILEAMAHGVPVITSRTSAMPEVAGDAALLIDPLEVDDLAHALFNLATNEPLQIKMAALGRARAAQFTWSDVVEKTWQLYSNLSHG